DLHQRIGQIARKAWEHMSEAEGYGRVDMRLSEEGQPYVLEVNPTPDLSSNAGLALMGRAFGWSYDDLVRIEDITRAVGLFREDEVLVALEVFDEAVGGAPGNTYSALGAEVDGQL